ncbi:hypothetical protein DFH07DRAFT_861400 [Mycena maculata]|uniref:Uncharacterized protein n=1 Tax=Mycena maculata TaxID=230809 RepID=A0AAD7MH87_9AGAR|nr:hypothetical protein DFH07DRAFT_861400 [Mycena maculata]
MFCTRSGLLVGYLTTGGVFSASGLSTGLQLGFVPSFCPWMASSFMQILLRWSSDIVACGRQCCVWPSTSQGFGRAIGGMRGWCAVD